MPIAAVDWLRSQRPGWTVRHVNELGFDGLGRLTNISSSVTSTSSVTSVVNSNSYFLRDLCG